MNGPSGEPTLGRLLGEMVRETGSLVRQEAALARAELKKSGKSLSTDMGVVVAGGALIHAGLLSMAAALVLGLDGVVAPWLSALGCGVAFALVGYALYRGAMRRLSNWHADTPYTIQSLQSAVRIARPPSNDVAEEKTHGEVRRQGKERTA